MANGNPLEKLGSRTIYARLPKGEGEVPVLVDDDYDGEWFASMRWMLNPSGYVVTIGLRQRGDRGGYTYLHHLVLKPKKGMWVSFKNGNKLDCRSSNFEYRTPAQNTAHRRLSIRKGMRSPNSIWASPYRGVNRQGRTEGGKQFATSRWTANFRGIYLGSFDNAEEAAHAYDAAIWLYYGIDDVRFNEEVLNFPNDPPQFDLVYELLKKKEVL